MQKEIYYHWIYTMILIKDHLERNHIVQVIAIRVSIGNIFCWYIV